MDRVRQLPVASERVTTDSFSRWPGKRSHMARPWAQAVLLPNQSEARGADRLASRRYSGANFRRCGVLVWAANLILAALDCDLRAPQGFRFAPCRLLIAVTRAAGNDEHKPLNGVFAPLLATALGTIIRCGEHSRGRQFFWTNQCEELTAGSTRGGGVEFVLTEWFYVGVLDPRLVLALDAGYLALSARRQSDRWRFNLRHLHGKRAGVVRFSDFALDIRRMAARQPLVGHAVTVERHSLELTVFGQIDPPVLISNGIPSCYRDSGRLLTGRQAHEHRDFGPTSWHPSLSPSSKSDAPDGSESESNLPFFEDGRSLGGRGTGAVAARDRRAAVMVGAFKHRLQCADEPVRKLAHCAALHCAEEGGGCSAQLIIGTSPEFCGSTDFKVRGDTPSAAKTMHRPPTNVIGTAAGLAA
jgi:hypothetical protein